MQQTFRILASLALTILCAVALNSCSKGSTAEATTTTTALPTAPLSEVDVMLNEYEKSANEYLRVSRRLKGGDLSVTIPYIQLGKELREWPAKHQQLAATMTPAQTQRAASIAAKTGADLPK